MCKTLSCGLTIGALLASAILVILLTLWLQKSNMSKSRLLNSNSYFVETILVTTTRTTMTSVTTTTQTTTTTSNANIYTIDLKQKFSVFCL